MQVGARDELHESETSQALTFRFDNASSENPYIVVDLVCSISLCALVAVFLNATTGDRNLPPLVSKGKQRINVTPCDERKKFMIPAGTKICLQHL